jgi:alanyl-tRNA synthetase
MTRRLYYTDSMLTSFDATIVGSEVADDRQTLILDQTAFYPTSGGQPHDTGQVGGVRVVDVIDRDDEVAHVLGAASALGVGQTVRGEIDWPRRFDHMQQHTGQHILSAAFDRQHGVPTVSFHLGEDSSTIDLARDVSPAEIAAAELEANRVVWDDRPVLVEFADEKEASLLPLRKEPVRGGVLRLVEVSDFDLSACGGTHVPRTGMIGIIAVSGWERFKGGSRVAFVCGQRALGAHSRLRDITAAAVRLLSVSADELPPTIERLQREAKDQLRELRRLQADAAGVRAERLRAGAETVGALRVVLSLEGGVDAAGLKALAQVVVAGGSGLVAMLVGSGQPAPVVCARSADAPFDAAQWMSRAITNLGGRGGGRPELAQGGLTAPADRILAWAKDSIR